MFAFVYACMWPFDCSATEAHINLIKRDAHLCCASMVKHGLPGYATLCAYSNVDLNLLKRDGFVQQRRGQKRRRSVLYVN